MLRWFWQSVSVIDGGGSRIFHGGDTQWHPRWVDYGRAFGPFDVAFLPINGARINAARVVDDGIPAVLTPEQAVIAAKCLGARRLVPIHCGQPDPPSYNETGLPPERLKAAAGPLPLEGLTQIGGKNVNSQQVAIVTAGGSGMGAEAAKRLAADGFHVAILSSSGKGEELAKTLGGIGITGSNQSNEDLSKLVDLAGSKWGRIDVLVNSAGHGPRGPLLEITDQDWHTALDVYLMNVIRASRLVTPQMQKQKSGSIINISTAWAFEPSPVFPTSGVFRAGLAVFTKIFADTYAPDNIRMNNILPGWIDSLPETDERRASVPMKRYGKTGEIAATVAFLASDAAGYITGQNIRVDGGLTRSV